MSLRLVKILAASILLPVLAVGGDAGFESPFMTGAGARALGMGGGFTSIADDGSAMFYNPSGLAQLQFHEISFMHMSLAEGTNYNFASWVYPSTRVGGFGVAMMRVGTDDIIRRNNYVDEGTFGYSNFQAMAGYGTMIAKDLSFGLNLKVVNQSLDTWSDYGFGLDLGTHVLLHKNISAGLILRDIIPPELKLNLVKESVPASIAAGIAVHDVRLSEMISVTTSFELEKVETRSARVHAGGELGYNDRYFLRAGYDRDNAAFGAGYRQNRLQFDYAYKVMGYIDDSHRLSVSFLLGSSVEDRRRTMEERQQMASDEILQSERSRQFDLYRSKADEFYYRFRLDSARTYYERALAFDENNQAIVGTIAAIDEALRFQVEERQRISLHELEMNTAVERYYQQAQNFYFKKFYPAAIDMLDLILDIEPMHPGANSLMNEIQTAIKSEISVNKKIAEQAEQENDVLQALEAYTRVLELDPGDMETFEAKRRLGAKMDLVQQLNLGIELYNGGKISEATKRFRAVLAIDPDNAIGLEYMKKIASQSKQALTLEDLQKDKAIWQHYVDGLRSMRDKQYNKAIEAWNKVLKVYPTSLETLNNLEQAKLRLKSEEESN
ncbi:MAG: PorV/PorQ family protein [bacterium]|nr:PorV/PorQ family protein [bacterium]